MSLKGFRLFYYSALLSVSNPFIFSNYNTRCMIEHNKCLWLNIRRFSVDACLSLPSSPVMVYRALALDLHPGKTAERAGKEVGIDSVTQTTLMRILAQVPRTS
jgi:hypothetical protein